VPDQAEQMLAWPHLSYSSLIYTNANFVHSP